MVCVCVCLVWSCFWGSARLKPLLNDFGGRHTPNLCLFLVFVLQLPSPKCHHRSPGSCLKHTGRGNALKTWGNTWVSSTHFSASLSGLEPGGLEVGRSCVRGAVWGALGPLCKKRPLLGSGNSDVDTRFEHAVCLIASCSSNSYVRRKSIKWVFLC